MSRTWFIDIDVADGLGGPLRRCDVCVEENLITQVVPAGCGRPRLGEVIRGTGLVLAPGFIDVHSHADNAPLLPRDDTSKILQGVTTEVVGNCGFSLAPRGANAMDLDSLLSRVFPPIRASWESFAELFDVLDERGYVTNVVPLVGHNVLRVFAMGLSSGQPSMREMHSMSAALGAAVDAGVFGMSTGLIYPPGQFCDTEEIISLVRELPKSALYTTHMRGEGAGLAASVDEAILVGRETGRRVEVSHLKATGRRNWGAVQAALTELDRARATGVDIRHDVYPYTASSTMLTALLPPWFQEGGNRKVLSRLSDPDALGKLRSEMSADSESDWENTAVEAGWKNITIASTASGRYEGWSIAALAERLSIDALDATLSVLKAEQLRVSMVVHQMSEGDVQTVLMHPLTMIGSDGLPPGVGGRPHPRMYGTFPRILAVYCRERHILTVPEAIRRMTSLPADTFRIPDRGVVAEGKVADLVAFDPHAISDLATYDDPAKPPIGIPWVMVNGSIVVREGKYVGIRAAKRLRPAWCTA